MKVCYFGTYDVDQPRTRVILEGLRKVGVEVVERHVHLWEGTEHKIAVARHPREALRDLKRLGRTYRRLLSLLPTAKSCNAVVYAHLGQIDLILTAWWFKLHRIPVIWDALISLYETVVEDRGLLPRGSFWSWWLKQIDRMAGRVADLILVDTPQNQAYWHTHFSIPLSKLAVVYVGAEDIFASVQPRLKPNARFNILFYGKYAPLHGVETIVRAAKLLEPFQHLHWTLIGTGQQRQRIDALAQALSVHRLHFVDWVPYEDLPHRINEADLCLGIFGSTGKAKRVVPNKVYQALAARCPPITADTPAARTVLFRDHMEAAVLVPPGDARALADAVLEMSHSQKTRTKLAQNGFELYRRYYSSQVIGETVANLIKGLDHR